MTSPLTLRKKDNYTTEDFDEAFNSFKQKSKFLNIWTIENELLEYNKLETNYEYLRQLDSGKRNNSESLYELEKILEELYKF